MTPAFSSLLLFVFAATFSPGGATVLATASGLRNGVWATMPLVLGMAGGLGVLAAAAALGLGGVMALYPSLEIFIRIAGTIYLLWLAFVVARTVPPSARADQGRVELGLLAGVFLLWLNPKAWATSLSAAAAFGEVGGAALHPATILGTVFFIFALLSLTLWATFGRVLGVLLRTDRQWRLTNGLFAILIVTSVIGLWLT